MSLYITPWHYEVKEATGQCTCCAHECLRYEVVANRPGRVFITRFSRKFETRQEAEAHMCDVRRGLCEL